MTRFIAASLLVAAASQAIGDTVYIRDTLYVPLRGGQSMEHRILHRGLRSGTPLERLEENEETGYTRVRMEDGMEGWLQTQYLVDEPIARTRLESATRELDEMEAQYQQALLRLREASEKNESLEDELAGLKQQSQALATDLDQIRSLAADTISIEKNNQRLQEEQTTLQTEIDALQQENDYLSDDRAQEWFLRGAGTILIGLLFGFWVGRRLYSRRSAGGWV